MTHTDKKWYKIGEVEYSTDLNFFMEHQILMVKNKGFVAFISRLESKFFDYFKGISVYNYDNIEQWQIKENCQKKYIKKF